MQGRGNGPCSLRARVRSDSPAGKCSTDNLAAGGPEPPPAAPIEKRPRVQLFLPIADIPVNVFLILAMGAAVGFVSGMFGIGGGFLMTPLLIFVGIAPAGVVWLPFGGGAPRLQALRD